jgi:cellobiose-specific phosphotransferase system component IIC
MNTQPKMPLRQHAMEMMFLSPFLLAGSIFVLYKSLPHVPLSAGFLASAGVLDAVQFPLIWRHWRGSGQKLFAVIVSSVLFANGLAAYLFLPAQYAHRLWPAAQFLAMLYTVLMSLTLMNRKRMKAYFAERDMMQAESTNDDS